MSLKKILLAVAAVQLLTLGVAVSARAATTSIMSNLNNSMTVNAANANTVDQPTVYMRVSAKSGNSASVMQWDLSGLPAGAVITDAYVTLYSIGDYAAAFTNTASILNIPGGTTPMNTTTLSWYQYNGLDTDGVTPLGFNYAGTQVTSSFGQITAMPGHTLNAYVDTDHASAADLTLINGRLALAPADQYLALYMGWASGTAYFQDYAGFNGGVGVGAGPALNLVYSVPEPGTLGLASVALVGLCFASRLRRSSRRAS